MDNSQLLERHFAGAPLHELADLEGVNSPETARARLIKAKREHVTRLAMDLLIASKTGEVVWLVVPATNAQEIAPALRYLAWVVEELEALTFRIKVEAVTKPDGIGFGLIDMSRGSRS